MHRPTVGSYEEAFYYEPGTPVVTKSLKRRSNRLRQSEDASRSKDSGTLVGASSPRTGPSRAKKRVTPNGQGYLTHKKPPPLRILQWPYAQGPSVVLGGRAVSYERGTPVFGLKVVTLSFENLSCWSLDRPFLGRVPQKG